MTPTLEAEPMMPTELITCLAYLRVSTERQADEVHTSLSDQEQAVRALASKLGASIGRCFTDAGSSGATASGRPAFSEMLAWCAANPRPTSARALILVLNDSRFGRFEMPDEAAYWRHHLSCLGWTVRFVEGDDVEGDYRSVIRAIGSAQASEYRRNLILNVRRGMKGSAVQGFWTRREPFGFRRQVVFPPSAARVLEPRQRKVSTEKVKLVPHEEEAQVVRWAFERYASGEYSLATLARALRKRVPRRRWSRTVVNHMLKNEAYRGAVVGGRRRKGESERYGHDEAHAAIVEPRLWSAVQERLSRNASLGKGARSPYLLSGLLICPHCSQHYTGGGGGNSRSRNPAREKRRFYRDTGGVTSTCPGPIGTVMRHIVDDEVIDMLGATVAKPSVRRRIERSVEELLAGAARPTSPSRLGLKSARAELVVRRERIIGAIAEGTLHLQEARGQIEEVRRGLRDHDAQIEALRHSQARAKHFRADMDCLIQTALDFPALAGRLQAPALRRLVEPWIGRLTFDKVTRTVTLGIRPVPALPSLLRADRQEPGSLSRASEEGRIPRSEALRSRAHGPPAPRLRRVPPR